MFNKKIAKQNPLTELNSFLLQVKSAFQTNNLEGVEELLKESGTKRQKEPLQEVIQNIQEKVQKPDDMSYIFNSLTNLLEKNLQESQNLQHLFKVATPPQITNQNTQNQQFLLDDKGVELIQQEILEEERKLSLAQNERLLEKIEQLNEQITELETQMHFRVRELRDLQICINNNFLVQRIQYSQEQNYVEEGVLLLNDDQILICGDYRLEQRFVLNIGYITNITYDTDFTIVLHYSEDDNENQIQIRLQNPSEFSKVDLGLWALLRKNTSLNQLKLFDNPLFERPFINDFPVDHKILKDQVKLIIEPDMKSSGHQTEKIYVPSRPPSPPQQQQQQPSGLYIIQSSPDESIKLQNALSLLKQGFCMVKYSKGQMKPNLRMIYLTQNELLLKWKEPLQPFDKKDVVNEHCILLSTIKEIKDSAEGSGFKKFAKSRIGKEDMGITIVGSRNLELDAPSQDDKILFIECLRIALKNPRIQQQQKKPK